MSRQISGDGESLPSSFQASPEVPVEIVKIVRIPERLALILMASRIPNIDKIVEVPGMLNIKAGMELAMDESEIAEALLPMIQAKGIVMKRNYGKTIPLKFVADAVKMTIELTSTPEELKAYREAVAAVKAARLAAMRKVSLEKAWEARKNNSADRRAVTEKTQSSESLRNNRVRRELFVLLADDEERRPKDRRYLVDRVHLYGKIDYGNLAEDISAILREQVTSEEIKTILDEMQALSKRAQEKIIQAMMDEDGEST